MEIGSIEKYLALAATEATTADLDHVPPLIVYRCLSAPTGRQALVDSARAAILAQTPGSAEALAMPRRTFGARPIEILSPTSRTVLTAAVRALEPALVPPSRVSGAWRTHRAFGLTGSHSHVVELDFASCYELIHHSDLRTELLLRSFDTSTVDALTRLLSGLGHRGRGLPQMLGPSDHLADTYLSVLDRRFARTGYQSNRFADDVRVLASSWEEANDIIDDAAEGGRSLGLVLSAAKTTVWLRESLCAHESEESDVLGEFVSAVSTDLAEWIEIHSGPYGAVEDRSEAAPGDAIVTAYWELLHQWHSTFVQGRPAASRRLSQLGRHVVAALSALADYPEGLGEQLIDDLLFDDPTRFEPVARYVLARHQQGQKVEARAMLGRLVSTSRQGPWAKLWSLHLAESFGTTPRAIPAKAREWVHDQVGDAHEVVRAQAAWVLARRGELTSDVLKDAYPRATEVSAPAIAAAVARQQATSREVPRARLEEKLVNAIRDDGRLNQEAFKWGS